jgi:hypothetical protein
MQSEFDDVVRCGLVRPRAQAGALHAWRHMTVLLAITADHCSTLDFADITTVAVVVLFAIGRLIFRVTTVRDRLKRICPRSNWHIY